jgi:hypothetical protein
MELLRKKGKLFILMFCLSFGLLACSVKDDDTLKETEPSQKEVEMADTGEDINTDQETKESNESNKSDESNESNESDKSQSEDVVEKSKTYAEQMATGNFTTVIEGFSKYLKGQLSEEQLKAGWDTTVADIGEYIGIHDYTTSKENDLTIVLVILEYENNGIQLRLVYNKESKIDGIWINYYKIEKETTKESNDIFEEIEIKIGDGDFPINGMLTLPKEVENPPIVILVHGSGQSDMNETIGASQNKPFRDIAHGLAEQGIATIRYNKRYFQYPELATKEITIEDEVLNDVTLAIEYAVESVAVDSSNIFILGHSLGGMLAPKIASGNTNVTGIISLAGSPRNLGDIILDQNLDVINRLDGTSDTDKEALIQQIEDEVHKLKNVTVEDDVEILGVHSSYWYSLNQIHTDEILNQLDIPMMFLQGAADFQVYADVDYVLWQTLLEDRENVTFHLYEGLNHLFMTTNGKVDITEYDKEGTVDSKVIEDIALFVKNN